MVLGGQVGVIDHLTIGAGAKVGATSSVLSDVPPGKTMYGMPAVESREFFRLHVLLRRLPEMQQQLRALLKRMEQLESAADDRKGS